jgi:hypothetical protein
MSNIIISIVIFFIIHTLWFFPASVVFRLKFFRRQQKLFSGVIKTSIKSTLSVISKKAVHFIDALIARFEAWSNESTNILLVKDETCFRQISRSEDCLTTLSRLNFFYSYKDKNRNDNEYQLINTLTT